MERARFVAGIVGASFLGASGLAAAEDLATIPVSQPPLQDDRPPPSDSRFGFVAGGIGEVGGDKLAKIYYTDGHHSNVRSGEGLTGMAGFHFEPDRNGPFSVRATIGFKYVTTEASDADIHLRRIPVEVIGSYRFPAGWRVGAGYVHQAGIKLEGDHALPDVHFKDADGFRIEAGWKCLLLSYVGMRYKIKSVEGVDEGQLTDTKFDADNFGLELVFEF